MSKSITGVSIWVKAFIPNHLPWLTKPIPLGAYKGQSAIPGPVDDWYLTDLRTFSPYYESKARVTLGFYIHYANPDRGPKVHAYCNQTTAIDPDSGKAEYKTGVPDYKVCYEPSSSTSSDWTFGVEFTACNPFFNIGVGNVSPDIDFVGSLQIDSKRHRLQFDGKVDNFPAFEMYLLRNVDVTSVCAIEAGKNVFRRSPSSNRV